MAGIRYIRHTRLQRHALRVAKTRVNEETRLTEWIWSKTFPDTENSNNRHGTMDNNNDLALMKFGIGQPVSRNEDPTLLRGEGRYTDDVNVAGPGLCRDGAQPLRAWHDQGDRRRRRRRRCRACSASMPRPISTPPASARSSAPIMVAEPRRLAVAVTPRARRSPTDKVRYVGEAGRLSSSPRRVAQAKDAAEAVDARHRSAARGHARRRGARARRAAAP